MRTQRHLKRPSLEGHDFAVGAPTPFGESDERAAGLERLDRLFESLELRSPRFRLERDVLCEPHGPANNWDLEDLLLRDVFHRARDET